jgi:hypothetical protein
VQQKVAASSLTRRADETQWRQYAISRPPLIVEFMRLSRVELAKVKRFTGEIEAWERGAKMVRLPDI